MTGIGAGPVRLSLVIAATESADATRRGLASLGPDRDRPDLEIVVAFDPDVVEGSALPPGPILVAGPSGADAHRLRSLGRDHARGPVVAFAEDSGRFAPGWVDACLGAFASADTAAITGPVAYAARASLVDRAVVLCEYAPFLAIRPGPASRLAGNNFAARADVVRGLGASVHETDAIVAARRAGGRALAVPGCGVTYARRHDLREAIRDRARFGRQYGALCGSRWSSLERATRIALGPLAWASQVGRLLVTLARPRPRDAPPDSAAGHAIACPRLPRRPRIAGPKRSSIGRVARRPTRGLGCRRSRSNTALIPAIPLAVALLAVWTAGEWLGWCLGGAVEDEVQERPDPSQEPAPGGE